MSVKRIFLKISKSGSCSYDIGTILLFWFGVFNSLAGAAHSAKEVPIYSVSGIYGEEVRLPCDISTAEAPNQDQDNVVLVLWYREDLGTPIYSVDAREKEFRKAERWADDKVLDGRARFETDSQPANLIIGRVTQQDEKVYRCRVDFKFAQTRNSKVNVTIVVPPQKITIIDEDNISRTTVVGPYAEGSDLRLKCLVYGGKPLPFIIWYKNSEMISNISTTPVHKNDKTFVQSSLYLKNLNRSDLNSQLTCAAENNKIKPALSTIVQLDMNFGPLDVKIKAAEQPLTAQRKYDLVCESTGSRPPAKLTWWKNNNRFEKTKDWTSRDGNTTTSTLSFIPTKEDSGRYLACHAENPVINGKKLETGWELQIHYIPETKVVLGTSLKPDTIKEGIDVYFDCIIDALPAVYKVEWRKNGQLLSHNATKGVIISNQSLVLQKVTRISSGNYTCTGFNTEGDGASKPLYLNVMYAPTCKSHQTRVYGIGKHETANVSCEVEANPANMTFRWKFNNSADSDDIPEKYVHKKGATSFVTHSPVSDIDYGTLLCWATNKVGQQKVPCVFHIIAAGKPDSVSNCSVSNVTLHSFSVRCLDGFNGGLPQSFFLRATQDEKESINRTSVVPSFVVTNLQPGTLYSVYIHAINPKGASVSYQMEVMTQGKAILQMNSKIDDSASERQQRDFKVTTTMSIVIGVAISLILAFCIIASLLRMQCLKREPSDKRKDRNSTGSGSLSGSDKNVPNSVYKNDVAVGSSQESADSDDRNPDIIPQPVGDINEQEDYLCRRQHISTIENRCSPSRNLLQYSNTPTGYPGYCTLRNGSVPLQDFGQMTTKTTSMHADAQFPMTSSGTLGRHGWPPYAGGVRTHQCGSYQTLPHPPRQPTRINQTTPHIMLEDQVILNANSPLMSNKQESAV